MRHPRVWLCTVVLFGLLAHGAAYGQTQTPIPVPYRVGELSFHLTDRWRVRNTTDLGGSGVVFTGENGPDFRFTVAKLPSSAATAGPLPETVDAMTAPETAEQRILLEESGMIPTSGVYRAGEERGITVESVGFRCATWDHKEWVVLITTWRGKGEALRARLMYAARSGSFAGLAGIRASLRYGNAPTLGFGTFDLSRQPLPPEWAALAPATPMPDRAEIPTSRTIPPLTLPANPVTTDVAEEQARILQDYRGSLVFIESDSGAGSGFVCRTKDGVFLLTNQHVLAGMTTPRFTRLDSTPIAVAGGSAAVGHDLMRFALQSETKPLDAMVNVEAEARVGDHVVVLGNGEGARVIQPLSGKLVGIGPDRIEVSSEFVPGNSGSPIVHVKTGKVIGIATYLVNRQYSELTNSREARVRRFGYRLDSAKEWQPLNWAIFQQDKATMVQVEDTTKDLMRLIKQMQEKHSPALVGYTNAAISRAVREVDTNFGRKGLSVPDRKRAAQNFFAAVRTATQADVAQARQRLRYDYFIRALGEENQVREEMYKLFDELVKR